MTSQDGEVTFRPLSRDDNVHVILTLLQGLTKVDLSATQEQFSAQVDEMRRRESYAFVGELNGQIVCMGTIMYEAKLIRGMREAGHIEDIVVREDIRGKGLGFKLVAHLVEHAKARGTVYKVFLDCDVKNRGFYEKLGFEDKGIQMSMYL